MAAISSPPESPLSSITSDEENTQQQPDSALEHGDKTPTQGHRRRSDVSHDGSIHPAKRRKIITTHMNQPATYREFSPPIPDDNLDDLISTLSEDSFGCGPGRPSLDEWTFRNDLITTCQWEGCDAGDLPNNDELVAHVQSEHIVARRAKYTCDWLDCQRRGTIHPSGYALKAHMRSHTKEKPFFCSLPGKNKINQ